MRIQCPLSAEQSECLERLRTTTRSELMRWFALLSPPKMETFRGEYDAELLNQGNRFAEKLTHAIFGINGVWTGKAFLPTNESQGVGYNCFLDGDKVICKLPMRTEIADSRLDTGRSLFIKYNELNRGAIRWLIGELREVVPTVILGFGTFGPKLGSRDFLRRKIPFVMVGPQREYQVTAMRMTLQHEPQSLAG